MASPEFAQDLITQLSALVGATFVISGASRNTWAGRARQTDETETPTVATFAQEWGGPMALHSDGRLRFALVQLAHRAGREGYQACLTRAKAAHDALDLCGRFTANGNVYMDVRASAAGPQHLEVDDDGFEWFVEDFELWYEG